MGWRRAVAYYWRRLQRIPGTPESIAAGFACGAAVSMLPFVGFHFLLAALCAWLVRGSILASAFGTIVGNPWTFPFIWIGTYELGETLMGVDRMLQGKRPFRDMFGGMTEAIRTLNIEMFAEQVWPVLQPMIVGSVPVALAVGFATYGLLVKPIQQIHDLRRRKKS